MDLLHLVDRLEELVASAQKMPIGSRAIVDRRMLLDVVDQMRIVIPQEVRDAQEMVSQHDTLRRDAEESARMIVARAEERATQLLEQHELTRAARARAEELAQRAEQRLEQRIAEANAEIQERLAESRRLAEHQLQEADVYAAELLRRLERQLQAFLGSVQSGLRQLDVEGGEAPAAGATAAPATERAVIAGAPLPARAGAATAPVAASPAPAAVRPRHLHEIPSDRADGEPELENLLRRPGADIPRRQDRRERPATGPGRALIDDFAQPHLDDEPPHTGE